MMLYNNCDRAASSSINIEQLIIIAPRGIAMMSGSLRCGRVIYYSMLLCTVITIVYIFDINTTRKHIDNRRQIIRLAHLEPFLTNLSYEHRIDDGLNSSEAAICKSLHDSHTFHALLNAQLQARSKTQ